MTFISNNREKCRKPKKTKKEVGRQVAEFMPLCWPVNVFPLFQALSAIYHLQAGRRLYLEQYKCIESETEYEITNEAKTCWIGYGKHNYILLCSDQQGSFWPVVGPKQKGPHFDNLSNRHHNYSSSILVGGNIKVNEFTTAIVCRIN